MSITVEVRGINLESMRVLKKKVQKAGIVKENHTTIFYETRKKREDESTCIRQLQKFKKKK